MIEEEPSNLKRQLEQHQCRVTRIRPGPENLNLVRWKYFDLIVCRLSPVRLAELWPNLQTDPQLARTPLVVLTSCALTLPVSERVAPVYYLANDDQAPGRLVRIIDQVHYLSSRYM
jgi:hypothetical protein